MKYRSIGKTELQVSEISFGCWTMGGLNWVNGQPNGWADVDEDEVQAGVKVGLNAGVNHFDNADVYGNGRAERMLARVLQKLGVKSTDIIIATKVGHFPGTAEHAYEPAHIRHQCEQSLINLKRDYVDIYYFHHGDFGPKDKYVDDAAAEVDKLVQEGKVRVKGLSAYSADDFERLVPKVRPQVLQSWANAIDDQFIRNGSRLQKLMEAHDLTFVAFSPLAQGRLLDKFNPEHPPQFEPGDHRKDSRSFSAEVLAELKPQLEKLKAKFGPATEDLAGVALQYVLGHPRVSCVIPGFRNARQAKCNIAGAERPFSEQDIAFVRDVLHARRKKGDSAN
jgi:aryl-alcohol dehydrogenase-like predicted oxidoreductase